MTYTKSAVSSGRRAFELAWPVEQHHEWIDAAPVDLGKGTVGKRQKYLVGSGSFFRYRPLEKETGLFKNFAGIQRSAETLQKFADQYGMLGHGEAVSTKRGSPLLFEAESYRLCIQELEDMQESVQLWDAINEYRKGTQSRLRKLIEWKDAKSVQYHRGQQSIAWIANVNYHPELLERIKYPDLVQPALHILQRIVDKKLKQLPSGPQLLWDRGELRMFIRPHSLIAAMWLQLALAIDGNRHYKTCLGCGKWFEVGSGITRSDSETCGPTCRKRKERRPKP